MPKRTSKPWRTNRARTLRSDATSAEALLWSKLRNRQLGNHKFVRQHPIGSFFADFVCRNIMLVVEIDGETHSTIDEIERDEIRDIFMRREGYRIVRVSNRDVYDSLEGVLDSISRAIEQA
jgi:very-short-patch-repair endonuclease